MRESQKPRETARPTMRWEFWMSPSLALKLNINTSCYIAVQRGLWWKTALSQLYPWTALSRQPCFTSECCFLLVIFICVNKMSAHSYLFFFFIFNFFLNRGGGVILWGRVGSGHEGLWMPLWKLGTVLLAMGKQRSFLRRKKTRTRFCKSVSGFWPSGQEIVNKLVWNLGLEQAS